MKFYDREKETLFLEEVQEKAKKRACFTILKGRRRVGKTSLLEKAYRGGDYLYFFVARRNEAEAWLYLQAEVESAEVIVRCRVVEFGARTRPICVLISRLRSNAISEFRFPGRLRRLKLCFGI